MNNWTEIEWSFNFAKIFFCLKWFIITAMRAVSALFLKVKLIIISVLLRLCGGKVKSELSFARVCFRSKNENGWRVQTSALANQSTTKNSHFFSDKRGLFDLFGEAKLIFKLHWARSMKSTKWMHFLCWNDSVRVSILYANW